MFPTLCQAVGPVEVPAPEGCSAVKPLPGFVHENEMDEGLMWAINSNKWHMDWFMNYSIFQSWSYVLYLISQEETIYCLKMEYCVPYSMQFH